MNVAIATCASLPPQFDDDRRLIEALRRLDAHNIVVQDVALHRPTLDDVFLSLTGHASSEEEQEAPA